MKNFASPQQILNVFWHQFPKLPQCVGENKQKNKNNEKEKREIAIHSLDNKTCLD